MEMQKALWMYCGRSIFYPVSSFFFFSFFLADRTPIISQTNTKHSLKAQNKGLETWYNNWRWASVVGWSQQSLIARGDIWTFGWRLWLSVSVDGQQGHSMKGSMRRLGSLTRTLITSHQSFHLQTPSQNISHRANANVVIFIRFVPSRAAVLQMCTRF